MLKIPKVINKCDDKYVCWAHTEWGQGTANDDVVFKLLNADFEVKINNIPCPVKECRVSAFPFNRPWPGKQRPYNQSESAGFISFSANETVELRVKRKQPFDNAIVRPLSKKVTVNVVDDEVVFVLSEHGQYVLEFGDIHNALHVFFNQIKDYPNAKDATVYFGPGIHFPGVITLRDNDTVYIDENAVVFGSIYSKGAKNVKIFGGGVLDNSCEERITEHCYENHTKGTFRIYNCKNIDVSDIILTNSSTWAMSMFNCQNIHFDNVKIVGHWRYNTDGIDIVNSENVLVENSFIRSFDDTISIKAIYDHKKPIQNITINNCVMWCGWGKNCEIGLETNGIEYKNIVFKNCDLIHNSVAAMCISNGNQADIHDVVFENINVEFQSDTLVEALQRTDEQEYISNGKTMPPRVIRNIVEPYAIRKISAKGIVREFSEKLGDIHDVVYKNINIYTDNDSLKPIITMKTPNKKKNLRNFKLDNIYLNGKKIKDINDFEIELENLENIIII
jgi:polygalacturonase